jgi:cytochrome c
MEVDDEPSPASCDHTTLADCGPRNGRAGQCRARRTHVPCLRRLPLARAQPQHDRPESRGYLESEAGSLASFSRYSPALKSAGIIWTDDTLDEWIKDTQHFIPGNTMTFPGMKDARQRAYLLAYLKDATRPGHAPKTAQGGNQMGGMMMGGGAVPNLKKLDPQEHVRSITHCGDTYKVTTADGKVRDFWERNLRFKTDVSDDGPQEGAPALVGAGMMGDRADVIFAGPEEISGFISQQC